MKIFSIKAEARQFQSSKERTTVYLWMIVLGFEGFLITKINLNTRPNHFDWLLSMGTVLGILIGWLSYLRRGDIKP